MMWRECLLPVLSIVFAGEMTAPNKVGAQFLCVRTEETN